MDEQLQPIRPPGQETRGPWLDPIPGREEGLGRGAGLTLGGRDSWQHGCCRGPQVWPSSSPGKQPAVFTPTRKSASGRLDPNPWHFSHQEWTSRYSKSDPRPWDTRGMARPNPGTARGAGKRGVADLRGRDTQQHGCCQGPQARPSSSPGKQPAVFTPTRNSASGWLEQHALPFSGLAWTRGYSQSDHRAGDTRGVARPKPKPGRGAGLML